MQEDITVLHTSMIAPAAPPAVWVTIQILGSMDPGMVFAYAF